MSYKNNPGRPSSEMSEMSNKRWAFEPDRTAATAPGRKAAEERFEKMVDPDGTLDPVERAKRAANARKAHYQKMARLSAKARAARKAAREEIRRGTEASAA